MKTNPAVTLIFEITAVLHILAFSAIAQSIAINDDGALPNSNAILDIDISTNNKGILIPRLTKTQRSSMSLGSGDIGLMVFQTDDAAGFWYWNSTAWRMVLADTNITTTVKRTLEIAGKGAGVSKTTTVIFDNNIVEQFNIGSELYFDLPLPLDYAGGDMAVYTDFVPMGAESGKTVRWNLIYKTHSSQSVLTGTTGTLDTGDILLEPTQYLEQDMEFTISEADITGKESIHFKIKRVAIGSGSNPIVDPAIVHVSILILPIINNYGYHGAYIHKHNNPIHSDYSRYGFFTGYSSE